MYRIVFILFVLLVVSASPMLAQSKASVTMSGRYDVTGTTASGEEYTGSAEISRVKGIYHMTWETLNDYEGVGLRIGAHLVVTYGSEACSVFAFSPNEDNTWGGWMADHSTDTPVSALLSPLDEETGEYNLNLTDMAEPHFINVAENGDALQMILNNDMEGIGILTESMWAAVFSDGDTSECGLALYQLQDDGSLEGYWGGIGNYRLLPETLTKTMDNPTADLVNNYLVIGNDLDGNPYNGSLSIDQTGAVFRFDWDAGFDHQGIGIQYGDVVAAVYGDESCDVAIYQLNTDTGALTGKWATGLDEFTGEESAILVSGDEELTEYEITGTNPNGTDYTGLLTVRSMGDNFQFQWYVPIETFGVAIQSGDIIGVAYGNDSCGLKLYELQADGTLVGRVAGINDESWSVEYASFMQPQ